MIDYLFKVYSWMINLLDISLIGGMGVIFGQAVVEHEAIKHVLQSPANQFLVYGGCIALLIRIISGVYDIVLKHKKAKNYKSDEE